MNDKKKKYLKPEADITEFASEDIITLSGVGKLYWGGEENYEDWE